MRIISGKFGGRKFQPPREMPHTRPTTDIAKQGLFNMLNSRMALDGISTLDLFGGISQISGDNIAHFAQLGGALTGFILLKIWNKTNRRTLY